MELFETDQIITTSDGICLDLSKITSSEELNLAYHLAKKSFSQNKNIAKNFNYEFLLWLSGKKDISFALSEYGAKEGKKIIFVVFANFEKWKNLKKIKLEKSTSFEVLERISLSRI